MPDRARKTIARLRKRIARLLSRPVPAIEGVTVNVGRSRLIPDQFVVSDGPLWNISGLFHAGSRFDAILPKHWIENPDKLKPGTAGTLVIRMVIE